MIQVPDLVKKYYKPPYWFDDVKYVWDTNNNMILMGDYDSEISCIITQKITNLLNGVPDITNHDSDVFTLDKGDVLLNGEYVLCIRGWGRIQQIKDKDATPEVIQDTFAQYVVDLLNDK